MAVESLFEKTEQFVDQAVNKKLLHVLWGKVLRELALLGIVSFTAVLMQNFSFVKPYIDTGGGWIFLSFEYVGASTRTESACLA